MPIDNNKLRNWSIRVRAIADEMDLAGDQVNSEHLDFVADNLECDKRFMNDPALTFLDNKFIGKNL